MLKIGLNIILFITSNSFGNDEEKNATKLPVLIGSDMNPDNIADYLPLADRFFVGSYFRKDGKFLEKLEPGRLNKFMELFASVRKNILH